MDLWLIFSLWHQPDHGAEWTRSLFGLAAKLGRLFVYRRRARSVRVLLQQRNVVGDGKGRLILGHGRRQEASGLLNRFAFFCFSFFYYPLCVSLSKYNFLFKSHLRVF